MHAFRDPAPVEVVSWTADTETEECDRIAETIQRLHAEGLPYRDIAVLVRSRAAYPELLDAFDRHQVPGAAGWPDRPVCSSGGQALRQDVRMAGRPRMVSRAVRLRAGPRR